ncbi:c-type cytochrome [Acidisoma cladoniae]|uniref:c-type cytochrome n=1 Tax=Acidisoma cladoniae TaxID=3040935 RepID=UPI00254FD35D|nr:cytochrome c [Acidisoma sp. PAMC 29798]
MNKKRLGGGAAVLLMAGLLAAHGWGATQVPVQTPGQGPSQPASTDAALLAKGKYLTTMGDCIGCHVADGGKAYAGGQYMGMPFGQISTPNITSDVDTGIGKYTDADFIRLMRGGVTPTGQNIYPAMPYPWYATLPDDDILAIKTYLFSLPPIHAPRLPSTIWFPFNLRPAIKGYNLLFIGDRFQTDPHLTAEQNRGAYIVNGLEHCGECHNHRNFLGNTAVALSVLGAPITQWYAPSLRFDPMTGLGRFSDNDIVQYLRDGHSPQMGTVAGPMSEVVDYSTHYLSDADLHAIVAYLHVLPPTPSYYGWKRRPYNTALVAGQQVYLSHCASCHQTDGAGLPGKIPALDGNGMVTATGPQSVIRVILGGLDARGPYALMPGVGATMTDDQIVAVTNYVRQGWSNVAPMNATPKLVDIIRRDTHTFTNGQRPDGCPTLMQDQLQTVLADKTNGLEDLLKSTTMPNLLNNVNAIVQKLHGLAPAVSRADAVNGLTIAYCPIVYGDDTIPADQRAWQVTHFADRLYTQLSTNGSD